MSTPVKEESVPIPTEHAPTSTIPKDSLYSLARNAANLLGSKGLDAGVTEGFIGFGCIVALVCAGGVGTALLSERRVTVSWQSTWM